MPDRIAQLPEPFEGGVFDNGFVEAHGKVSEVNQAKTANGK